MLRKWWARQESSEIDHSVLHQMARTCISLMARAASEAVLIETISEFMGQPRLIDDLDARSVLPGQIVLKVLPPICTISPPRPQSIGRIRVAYHAGAGRAPVSVAIAADALTDIHRMPALFDAELAAFDGFWQCQTLDTGLSCSQPVTLARRAPKTPNLL
jgi:hypothetical protein